MAVVPVRLSNTAAFDLLGDSPFELVIKFSF